MSESSSGKDRNWPKDEFGRHEAIAQWVQLWWAVPIITALFASLLLSQCSPTHRNQVIVYCAQDQVFAEPIFREFEHQTGIKVRAVFDNEAVKTVGLANRLLAERGHPQCDVFWGNEEMRTRQLAAQNVFRERDGWVAFGYRSRRIVVNTNRLGLASAPRLLSELTNAMWAGKVALAYPLFGTTATHFHALRQLWGDEPPLPSPSHPAPPGGEGVPSQGRWLAWCRALAANKPMLVDGNSVVVSRVGAGDAWIGLSDSDDIAAGQREGLPVAAEPMTPETLLIPNTVAIVRGAPHPQAAQRLIEYLQGPQVIDALVRSNALEGASISQVAAPTLQVNWDALLEDLEKTTAELSKVFLR